MLMRKSEEKVWRFEYKKASRQVPLEYWSTLSILPRSQRLPSFNKHRIQNTVVSLPERLHSQFKWLINSFSMCERRQNEWMEKNAGFLCCGLKKITILSPPQASSSSIYSADLQSVLIYVFFFFSLYLFGKALSLCCQENCVEFNWEKLKGRARVRWEDGLEERERQNAQNHHGKKK